MIMISVPEFALFLLVLLLAGCILIWHIWQQFTAPPLMQITSVEARLIGALCLKAAAQCSEQERHDAARRWRQIAAQFEEAGADDAPDAA